MIFCANDRGRFNLILRTLQEVALSISTRSIFITFPLIMRLFFIGLNRAKEKRVYYDIYAFVYRAFLLFSRARHERIGSFLRRV